MTTLALVNCADILGQERETALLSEKGASTMGA